MQRYDVIVEGRNFLFDLEGERIRAGFFTTVAVEASSPAELRQRLLDSLVLRLRNNAASISTDDGRSYIQVSRICPSGARSGTGREGFTFYRTARFGVLVNHLKYFCAQLFSQLGMTDAVFAPERLTLSNEPR